jgi:hypothetical protein
MTGERRRNRRLFSAITPGKNSAEAVWPVPKWDGRLASACAFSVGKGPCRHPGPGGVEPGLAGSGGRAGLPTAPARSTLVARLPETAERTMSKGLDQKKQDKKKPEKTLKEKRAEKKEKKGK